MRLLAKEILNLSARFPGRPLAWLACLLAVLGGWV